jgi:hypothetical protein
MKSKKTNRIGHILRRNCLLKHVIERKIEENIEVTDRRRRRRKQLQNNFKNVRGYWKLKAEALDRTLREIRFGWWHGSVVKDYRMNKCID